MIKRAIPVCAVCAVSATAFAQFNPGPAVGFSDVFTSISGDQYDYELTFGDEGYRFRYLGAGFIGSGFYEGYIFSSDHPYVTAIEANGTGTYDTLFSVGESINSGVDADSFGFPGPAVTNYSDPFAIGPQGYSIFIGPNSSSDVYPGANTSWFLGLRDESSGRLGFVQFEYQVFFAQGEFGDTVTQFLPVPIGWALQDAGATGDLVTFDVRTAVPSPGAVALFGFGACAGLRRRRSA